MHGEKVRCGVCVDFVFPKSYWRLYRQHHRKLHPEQDFIEPLPFDTKPKNNLEEWEIPPEDGFFEVGSPVSEASFEGLSYSGISSEPLSSDYETVCEMQDDLYSPITSDVCSSGSEWETVSEVNLPNMVPLKAVAVPVVTWRLVPVDVPPRGPFRGEKKKMGMDPRMEKYSAFFERL